MWDGLLPLDQVNIVGVVFGGEGIVVGVCWMDYSRVDHVK